TGEEKVKLADSHPAKLRHDADKAKLISSNDSAGYTFRGKFLTAEQAVGVSFEVTQRAHSALQWLIRRQAFRSGDQVFVSWATTGKPIPNPCANSWDFLGDDLQTNDTSTSQTGDVGQAFALRFKKKLAGYKANISDAEDIVVMGLNSVTPGRMAITFYRELTGSEFLERIEKWHSNFAWLQNFGRDKTDKKKMILFEGAPAPKDIAWCTYGSKVEGKNGIKLLNTTVERLLPSIIDGRPVPRDLVEQCVRRVSNRPGLEPWEFEKNLGIACSLFKGFYNERGYIMALEEERCSRDYLYGRLLAVAEKIESMALYFAKEPRETTAARLMQRFADRPYSTWRTIKMSLTPYEARINAKAPGLLAGYRGLVDTICCQFQTDEFMQDHRLSGEFLLAYHCQRKWLNEHKREKGQWVLKIAGETENQEADAEA
ncbi:MAG: type I-C CRISPR-associated protein Cas8c/Csd1, partial [Smithella sp.]